MIIGATPDVIFGQSFSFHHRMRSTTDGYDHGFSTSMNHRLLNVEINLQHADKKLDLILQALKYVCKFERFTFVLTRRQTKTRKNCVINLLVAGLTYSSS